MEYLTVEEAKHQDGLRLVLTRGVPGPWSEAAKAVFSLRNVDYKAVEQIGGGGNPDLVAWTGHRNAPIAIYNDEPPRVRWLEILDLAERLGSGASLVPEDRQDRMLMMGLTNEIAGENGMLWNARILMLHLGVMVQGKEVAMKNPMYAEYGYSENKIEEATQWLESFFADLASHIKTQTASGSEYLIGDQLSAADVYWAFFSNALQALPPEQNPMPDGLRKSWGALAQSISGYDPVLIEQRDLIFEKHLSLPLSF